MSEIRLKLCPFCGGMAYLGVDYENSTISTMLHDYIYFIKCQSCGALIYGDHNRKYIADKWNRRAGEQNEWL